MDGNDVLFWAWLACGLAAIGYMIFLMVQTPERCGPYNAEWDEILNDMIDKDMIDGSELFTVKAGDLEIWTENYPFSYGHPYRPVNLRIMPSRRTQKRLKDHLDERMKSRALSAAREALK